MKNTAPQIARDELVSLLSGPNSPLVVDVLPEEDYNVGHVPGAKNACVFKVSFLEDVLKLGSDHSKPLVVYGASSRDLAASTAAQKLTAAGYRQVSVYAAGMEDWAASRQVIERGTDRKHPKPRNGSHSINLLKSKLDWTGRNIASTHYGTLNLSAGELQVQNGWPVSGNFTVDMNSLEDLDIPDSKLRQVLVHHLKSDDFFDVEQFPTAQFNLSQIKMLPDSRPGSPNSQLTGELILKGVRNQLSFPGIIAVVGDGLLAADAHFDIDRTRWNVLYGSGKFYEKLGMHLVNDDVSLALKLVTLPSPA